MTSQRLSRSIFGAELCNRPAPVFKIQSLIVIHCFRDMSSRPGIVVSIGKGQIRPAGKCEARCAKLYHDGCLFISKGYRAGRRGRNCTHGLGGRRRRREQSARFISVPAVVLIYLLLFGLAESPIPSTAQLVRRAWEESR